MSLPRAARHNPLAATGAVLVIIFVIFAVFAPWIAPQDPAYIDLPTRLSPPSSAHWCGTDELGRDILSRLIYGSRPLLGGEFGGRALARPRSGGGIDRRLLWRKHRSLLQRGGHERVSIVPRNLAGDCLCGFSWSGNFQSRLGAFSGRLGGLRPPGSRTGTGGA